MLFGLLTFQWQPGPQSIHRLINGDDKQRLFTVKSFGEEKNCDAEEDEKIDNLLAVIFDVVSNIFEEDRPSRGQLDVRLSGITERAISHFRTMR